MTGTLYRRNYDGMIYIVGSMWKSGIKLMCTQPPYTVLRMSKRNLEQHYTPITTEDS